MAEDEQGGGKLPEQVDTDEARSLVAGGKVRVIDVRSEDEFAAERLTNAVHADPDDLGSALEDDGSGREAVLVVCADGSRSAEVAEQLRSDGTDATSIDGGFEAWRGDGLPTAPGRDEEYEGPAVVIPGAVASTGEEDEGEEEGGESEEEEDADGERG